MRPPTNGVEERLDLALALLQQIIDLLQPPAPAAPPDAPDPEQLTLLKEPTNERNVHSRKQRAARSGAAADPG